MMLRAISDGKISGTGTLTLPTGILGQVLVTSDGTNACVVRLRKDNASGELVFDLSTKRAGQAVNVPIYLGTTVLYYDITGTNGSAMIYEYVS